MDKPLLNESNNPLTGPRRDQAVAFLVELVNAVPKATDEVLGLKFAESGLVIVYSTDSKPQWRSTAELIAIKHGFENLVLSTVDSDMSAIIQALGLDSSQVKPGLSELLGQPNEKLD
jgi:hypothetical protein